MPCYGPDEPDYKDKDNINFYNFIVKKYAQFKEKYECYSQLAELFQNQKWKKRE